MSDDLISKKNGEIDYHWAPTMYRNIGHHAGLGPLSLASTVKVHSTPRDLKAGTECAAKDPEQVPRGSFPT